MAAMEDAESIRGIAATAAAKLVEALAARGCVVADRETCAARLAALIAGGSAQLSVIMDFDRTLSTAGSESAHGVMAKALSPQFQELERALFKQYYPMEQDLTMPLDEKIPLMKEWYFANHLGMLQERVTQEMICDAVKGGISDGKLRLRDGAADVLRFLAAAGASRQILSAGLADVIEAALAQMCPEVQIAGPAVGAPGLNILSNKMKFARERDGAALIGFEEPLVHMYNKAQRAGIKLGTALLVGDSLGDLTMHEGADAGPSAVLKVGFLNAAAPDAAAVQKYAVGFDIVILNDRDPTFGVVADICRACCAH